MPTILLFFELIQVAIGTRHEVSRVPTQEEWQIIFEESVRQSLVGLLFSAIEKLNNNDASFKPHLDLFLEWMGRVRQIEKLNESLNVATKKLTKIVENGGARSCVLKGQGTAQLYPDPFRRVPGDIDLWVFPDCLEFSEESLSVVRKEVLKWLHNNHFKIGSVVVHHADAAIMEGVKTEIHFMPIWLYNPVYNSRLQQFFRDMRDEQFSNYNKELGFSYPRGSFNVVYNMVHIFHHFLDEGVGLRQVVDYYFVLRSLEKITDVSDVLRHLGMMKFAGALMYVLKEVCAIDEGYMLCKPNEKAGRILLSEIMITGNFGQFDKRYDKTSDRYFIARNGRKAHRLVHFTKDYPKEILCIPMWKLWHFCWRKWNGYL